MVKFFWQVTADMTLATTPPGGHGHNYHSEFIPIWLLCWGFPATTTPWPRSPRQFLRRQPLGNRRGLPGCTLLPIAK
ncbi:hypothetical protein JCM18916_3480 [Cutibacterium acnes JCM 18916]|nr:hypothetical protein JCM18916_3480 [Cutibacterium acnes JCM 18916]